METRRAILVDEPDVGNQEAIARLETLAVSSDLTVTVLVAPGEAPNFTYITDYDLGAVFQEKHQQRAQEIAEELEKQGIKASGKVRIGVRSIEIIREALDSGADYLVKVAEGSVSRRSRLGSTDLHLLRKCPCPVWLTRPREHSPYQRVFAAVDPRDLSPKRGPDLDVQILKWAIEIARTDKAELTILHAWEAFDESLLLHGRGYIPPPEMHQLVDETRLAHERQVTELLSSLDLTGIEQKLQIVKGRPSDEIPIAVERGRADLLVMGTVVRTGLKGFFIGSTAEEVIPQVRCAILAVKPNEFVSPVER